MPKRLIGGVERQNGHVAEAVEGVAPIRIPDEIEGVGQVP
jgi:hypothetical protein